MGSEHEERTMEFCTGISVNLPGVKFLQSWV